MSTIEELELMNSELTQALKSANKSNAQLNEDFEARVEAEAARLTADYVAQQKLVDADLAAQRKTRLLTKPSSWAAYAAHTSSEKATLMGLYGAELVSELLNKKTREDKAALRGEQVKALGRYNKFVK